MDQKNSALRLYTAQTEAVCQVIFRDGVCFSREEFVSEKYGESAPGFLTAYRWFAREAPRLVPRPEGAQLPYWAFADLYSVEASGPSRVLTLEVPRDQAVLFDLYDWNRVLQLGFLGEEADARAFRKELSLRGLREFDVMTGSFYPELRRAIEDSWQRLFRHHAALLCGDTSGAGGVQAGLWCIRREWIVDQR